MPNVRVGILPQQHEQSTHARKQGITLEDLKKQTALRLAQEHQKTEFFPTSTQKRKDDIGPLGARSSQHDILGNSQQPVEHVIPFNAESPRHVHRSPRSSKKPNELQVRAGEIPPHTHQPSGGVYPRPTPTVNSASYKPESSNEGKSKLPQGLTVQELKEITKIIYPRPQAPTLPHGLTVQELKEMTKARLDEQRRRSFSKSKEKVQYQQPSPSRKSSQDLHENYFLVDTQQQRGPLGTNHVNQMFVQDGMLSSPSLGCASESMLSSPSLVYAPERMFPSPAQTLVGPPGFQPLPPQGTHISGVETSQMHSFGRNGSWQHARDAWESGSVASHNSTINSDFLGSDCNPDEFGEIQFQRTLSYPGGRGMRVPDRPYEVPLAMPVYYDNTPNQNRRRAATLSPRLELSHLHEDRPSFPGMSERGMPINVSEHGPIPMHHSPEHPRTRVYSDGAAMSGDFTFNRERTSSAPTMSTFFSMTGEMFGDVCGGLSALSAFTGDSELYQSNSELPNSMVESILDEASGVAPNNSDYSSVIRSLSQEAVDAGLKNPWGERNVLEGDQHGFRSLDVDHALSQDLDNVLSLSGIDAPPPGFHHQQHVQPTLFPNVGSSINNGPVSQYQLSGFYGNPSSFASRDGSRRQGDYSQGD